MTDPNDTPDKKAEVLKRETLFQGYFRVDRYHLQQTTFAGGWSEPFMREIMDRGRAAAGVLLFDPQKDKVVLVEQFRIGPFSRGDSAWLTEVVAGIVEPGESPEETIYREAREEAGCEVLDLQKLFAYYPSPGCLNEYTTLFVGRTQAPEDGIIMGLAQEHEDIRVHVLDAAEAISMLYAHKIRDAATLVAMQWFAMHHTDLRSRWLVSHTSTPII